MKRAQEWRTPFYVKVSQTRTRDCSGKLDGQPLVFVSFFGLKEVLVNSSGLLKRMTNSFRKNNKKWQLFALTFTWL